MHWMQAPSRISHIWHFCSARLRHARTRGHSSTHQLPSLLRNAVDASNGLHENVVRNTSLRHPNCAEQVYPFAVHGLFERAAFVRTQDALLHRGTFNLGRGKD